MVSADNIKKELKVAALSINLHQPDIPNIPITDKVTMKAVSMDPKNVLNEIPATKNITKSIKGVKDIMPFVERN